MSIVGKVFSMRGGGASNETSDGMTLGPINLKAKACEPA